MLYTDDDGEWEIDGHVRLLIKPSTKWLIANPQIAPLIPYDELRRMAYPSFGDQLDAIWKGGEEMELMRHKILAIKQKYPKP